MRYFDIHSHLNFPDYTDLNQAIRRMKEAEVGTIVVGTDLESSKIAVEIAEQNENIWACIGIHPIDKVENFDTEKFESLVSNPRVVAIGECGFDFHHAEKGQDFERQKDLFLKQIDFALLHDLSLMIHVRDAYEEALEILTPLKEKHGKKLRGNMHFFAADLDIAKKFWALDFTTSFTGAITYPAPKDSNGGWRDPNTYAEIIREAPLEMIMSETDAPFVSPVPYRGKRNEPSYVTEVVKKIAEIRGEDLAMVQQTILSNVSRVFKIQ